MSNGFFTYNLPLQVWPDGDDASLLVYMHLGIDRSFISDVERGRKSISLHMLEVIAIGMGASLSDLLAGV